MSAEQTRRSLNQFDKEIADYEKKLADLARKEADKTKRINDVQKSITKNTSSSMVSSKLRQIQGYQDELTRVLGDKADVNKRIADKRKKRAESAVKLQQEEAAELHKSQTVQQTIHRGYEKKIAELSYQLEQQFAASKPIRHIYEEDSLEEYDVFISHASEDKKDFADALCQELQNCGIKVWYDTLSISWGDSLRSKIDEGLNKSQFGIVIISKDYIRKGWTQYELDGMFQIEMTNGKTILPIWHNITKDEVQAFSPTLAGRKAMSTAVFTVAEIVEELKKLLNFHDSVDKNSDIDN